MYPITMKISQNCLKGFPKSAVQSLSHVQLFCNPMDYTSPGSFVHGNSPGKTTAVGNHFLLQGLFLTQGSNPCLSHSLPLSRLGSPSLNYKNINVKLLLTCQIGLSAKFIPWKILYKYFLSFLLQKCYHSLLVPVEMVVVHCAF